MKVWIRSFKVPRDVVMAPTEEDAMAVDCSDACEEVQVEYAQEVDRAWLLRAHPSWRDYIPLGDDDCRTLGEIFGVPAESESDGR